MQALRRQPSVITPTLCLQLENLPLDEPVLLPGQLGNLLLVRRKISQPHAPAREIVAPVNVVNLLPPAIRAMATHAVTPAQLRMPVNEVDHKPDRKLLQDTNANNPKIGRAHV